MGVLPKPTWSNGSDFWFSPKRSGFDSPHGCLFFHTSRASKNQLKTPLVGVTFNWSGHLHLENTIFFWPVSTDAPQAHRQQMFPPDARRSMLLEMCPSRTIPHRSHPRDWRHTARWTARCRLRTDNVSSGTTGCHLFLCHRRYRLWNE